jgi:hypothetical protein
MSATLLGSPSARQQRISEILYELSGYGLRLEAAALQLAPCWRGDHSRVVWPSMGIVFPDAAERYLLRTADDVLFEVLDDGVADHLPIIIDTYHARAEGRLYPERLASAFRYAPWGKPTVEAAFSMDDATRIIEEHEDVLFRKLPPQLPLARHDWRIGGRFGIARVGHRDGKLILCQEVGNGSRIFRIGDPDLLAGPGSSVRFWLTPGGTAILKEVLVR